MSASRAARACSRSTATGTRRTSTRRSARATRSSSSCPPVEGGRRSTSRWARPTPSPSRPKSKHLNEIVYFLNWIAHRREGAPDRHRRDRRRRPAATRPQALPTVETGSLIEKALDVSADDRAENGQVDFMANATAGIYAGLAHPRVPAAGHRARSPARSSSRLQDFYEQELAATVNSTQPHHRCRRGAGAGVAGARTAALAGLRARGRRETAAGHLLVGWLFVLPALLAYAAFVIYPLITASSTRSTSGTASAPRRGSASPTTSGSSPTRRCSAPIGNAFDPDRLLHDHPGRRGPRAGHAHPLDEARAVLERSRRPSCSCRRSSRSPQPVSPGRGCTRRPAPSTRSSTRSASAACSRPWLGDFQTALPAVGLIGSWVLTGLCTVLLPDRHRQDRRVALRGGPPRRRRLVARVLHHHASGAAPGDRRARDDHDHRGAQQLRHHLHHHPRRPRPRDPRARHLDLPASAFTQSEVGLASAFGIVLMILVLARRPPHPATRERARLMIVNQDRGRSSAASSSSWSSSSRSSRCVNMLSAALQPADTNPTGLTWPTRPAVGATSSPPSTTGNVWRLMGSSLFIVAGRRADQPAVRDARRLRARQPARSAAAASSSSLLILGLTIPFEALIIPLYYEMQVIRTCSTPSGRSSCRSIGLYMPFSVFWMRAHFVGVPPELSEAARVDGATIVAGVPAHPAAARAARRCRRSRSCCSSGPGTSSCCRWCSISDPLNRTVAGALDVLPGAVHRSASRC